MWNGILEDSTINQIISECETYPAQDANLGFDGNNKLDNYRNSEIRWINKMNPNSRFISDLLWNFAEEANKNAFGFDISSISQIQYTIYEASSGGKYDWHFDTFWANLTTFDRKLSVIIQLSDSDDYEGGDFELDQQYPQPENIRNKGTVFVFPSFMLHRVTPVTKGIRKSLVSWIEGPKFR